MFEHVVEKATCRKAVEPRSNRVAGRCQFGTVHSLRKPLLRVSAESYEVSLVSFVAGRRAVSWGRFQQLLEGKYGGIRNGHESRNNVVQECILMRRSFRLHE